MMDQVEQLEQHVETLLKLLESAKIKIGEINRENENLQQQLDNLDEELKDHKNQLGEAIALNGQLKSQVERLEGDVEGMTSKESQIRDRLRTILSKIDSIETELTSAGSIE